MKLWGRGSAFSFIPTFTEKGPSDAGEIQGRSLQMDHSGNEPQWAGGGVQEPPYPIGEVGASRFFIQKKAEKLPTIRGIVIFENRKDRIVPQDRKTRESIKRQRVGEGSIGGYIS